MKSHPATRTLRLWFALALLGAATMPSCKNESTAPVYPNLGGTRYANVGLYTPGSKLGAIDPSRAATSADAAVSAPQDVAMGDRCTGTAGAAGTPGTLTLDFSTQPIGEHWGPANVGAVWIEDASGVYIKTIERWAAIRSRSLYKWSEHACLGKWPEPDVVSEATRADHGKPHHCTWTGKDLNGKLVPDGKYKVFIEVTETETNYGPMVSYEFEKGTMPQVEDVPDKLPHKGLKISYEPMK